MMARPQHPWTGWAYTADELEQMNYEGFEPVEVKMENKVSVLTVNKIMDAAEITAKTEFGKVTIVSAKLPNGFVIVESSGAVSPENYDFEMGQEICLKRIRDKVWAFEGYKLASELLEVDE